MKKIIKPRGPIVVIRPVGTEEDSKSKGGVLLAAREEEDRMTGKMKPLKHEPHRGRIVSKGPDCKTLDDVQIGDEVIFNMHQAIDIMVQHELLLMVEEQHIIGTVVFEDEPAAAADENADDGPPRILSP